MSIVRNIILNVFCLISLGAFGQEISGIVVDEFKQPLSYANVVVLKSDSTYMSSTITDDNGIFKVNFTKDIEFFNISYLGYSSKIIKYTNNNLGIIQLEPNSEILNEVIVKGSRPLIKREIDRLVFNVEESPISQGSSAFDLLKQTPLVKATDNSIGIIGKSGVRIMLNGKLSYLDGNDLMQYLKSVQSDDISSIEVITTPPSKYDAGGNGGMINIITKKNPAYGWNGSMGASYTQRSYAGENLNSIINYRSAKSYLSLKLRQNHNKGTIYENYNINQHEKSQHSDTKRIDTYDNYGLNVTFEQQLTQRSSFGAIYDFSYGKDNINMSNSYKYFRSNVLDSLLTTCSLQKGNTKAHTLNAYYDIQLDTIGKNLGLVVNYMHHSPDKNVDFTTINHSNDVSTSVHEPNYITYSILTGETNLELPLSWMYIETGFKYSDISNKSNMEYYNLIDENYIPVNNRCNKFNYREQTLAGYISMRRKLNNHFTLQAGLRYEHTFTKGITPGKDTEDVRNDYGKFFPTVYLSYALNSENIFNLNYTRRINRPYFRAVNPFKWYTNPNNVDEGNPTLKPSFADNIELNYIFRSNLSTTIYFQKENDAYGQMMYVSEDNTTYSTYQNIYNNRQFGTNISYNLRLSGWFSSYISGNYVYNKSEISIPGYKVQNGHSFFFRVNNTISFDTEKRFQLFLNYSHNFPYHIGVTYDENYANFSAGLKGAFINNNLIINIYANDIFKQDLVKRRKVSSSSIQSYNNYYDSRYIRVSITYKWGNSQLKNKTKRISFNEKNRI